MYSQNFQTLLNNLYQSHSQAINMDTDIKSQILYLYENEPSSFCESVVDLIMAPNQQARQQGIYLLNYVAKQPFNMALFDQKIIQKAQTKISSGFYSSQYGDCTIRYKAIGILYSRVLSVQKINIIFQNLSDEETTNTIPWLRCFSELLLHLNTVSENEYFHLSSIFRFFIKKMIIFEEQAEQLLDCYSSYIYLTKKISSENRITLLEECLIMLSQLIEKSLEYRVVQKEYRLYFSLCSSLPLEISLNMINVLYKKTRHLLRNLHIQDIWIDLIQQIDFQYYSSSVYQRTVYETLECLSHEMINMIDTLGRQNNQNSLSLYATPIKFASISTSNSEKRKNNDGYDNDEEDQSDLLMYTSAELLISLLKKLCIQNVKHRIKEKAQDKTQLKANRILYNTIYCCSLRYRFQQEQLNEAIEKIFHHYRDECLLLTLQQSLDPSSTPLINSILYGVNTLLHEYKEQIMNIKPMLLAGIYNFILSIVQFDLNFCTSNLVRDAFSEIMVYGEKYFMNKASNQDLRQIVYQFILNQNPKKERRIIKDIIADFGIELMKKKGTREERFVFLNEVAHILILKDHHKNFDKNIICKFSSALLEQIGQFQNKKQNQKKHLQNFIQWIFGQMKMGCSVLLEPFAVLFKHNYHIVSSLMSSEHKSILMNVGTNNPTLYFPLLYDQICKSNELKDVDKLFFSILTQLSSSFLDSQRLQKLATLIIESYNKFHFFRNNVSVLIEAIFSVLVKFKRSLSDLIRGHKERSLLYNLLIAIIFSQNNNDNFQNIQNIQLHNLFNYLNSQQFAVEQANYSITYSQATQRIQLLRILSFFVGIKAKPCNETKELIRFLLMICRSIPVFKVIKGVDRKLFSKMVNTCLIATKEVMKAIQV